LMVIQTTSEIVSQCSGLQAKGCHWLYISKKNLISRGWGQNVFTSCPMQITQLSLLLRTLQQRHWYVCDCWNSHLQQNWNPTWCPLNTRVVR
jgi:hypothetical protein